MFKFFRISKKNESREDKLREMWTRIYKSNKKESLDSLVFKQDQE